MAAEETGQVTGTKDKEAPRRLKSLTKPERVDGL
jgi:hypothetical protein